MKGDDLVQRVRDIQKRNRWSDLKILKVSFTSNEILCSDHALQSQNCFLSPYQKQLFKVKYLTTVHSCYLVDGRLNDLDDFGIDSLHISDPAGRISKSDGDPGWNWHEIVAHSLQQEAEIERLKGTGRIYLYCYGFMKAI